jgi:hypothetical protein
MLVALAVATSVWRCRRHQRVEVSALGATRWDILRYLLLENLLATQIGNGLGLASTLLLVPAWRATRIPPSEVSRAL